MRKLNIGNKSLILSPFIEDVNDLMQDKVKEYLKTKNIKKSEFAKLVNISPSRLSNFLNGRGSWETENNIFWFFRKLEIIKNKEDNFKKYGLGIRDIDIKYIKVLYNEIEKCLKENKNTVHLHIDNENWYKNDDVVKYFDKYNIQIDIHNYRKTGLFTDSNEHVDIYITWIDNIALEQLRNDIEIFKKEKLINES